MIKKLRPDPTLVLPKIFSDSLPEMARPMLCALCSSLAWLLGICLEVAYGGRKSRLGDWADGVHLKSIVHTDGKSPVRAWCARSAAGAPPRWGRAFEGQELLQEAEAFGPMLFKAQSRIELNSLRGGGSL